LGSPDDEPIELVQLDGHWRIRRESLDPYPQSGPLAALRSFVSALERHRYDVSLRLCPSRDRLAHRKLSPLNEILLKYPRSLGSQRPRATNHEQTRQNRTQDA
jgi:hypothetical protein